MGPRKKRRGTADDRRVALPGGMGPRKLRPVLSSRGSIWFRFALAAVAGVVWAVAFPSPGLAGLAWMAPGVLLAATAANERTTTWRLGYVAAAVHYLISLSWLRFIPFPAGAFAGWFALSLFLALFPPLWLLACHRGARTLGVLPTNRLSWRELAERLSTVAWWRLNLWFLFCAAAWVAWEMVIARLWGGFPWNLLGASQYRLLPIIQTAAFVGVYGVSFFIVWFSVSLLTAVLLLIAFPDQPRRWRRPLVFPALVLVLVTGGGFLRVLGYPRPTRQLAVALVQPSIPQTVIFDPDAVTNRFEALERLSEQALAAKPDVLVWPEASLPGSLSRDNFNRIVDRVREAHAWWVFGADEVEATPGANGEETILAYNAAFLVNPEGQIAATYHKRRLVMFGEYIPFGHWLPFLQRLAPIGDGFEAGREPVPFALGDLGVTASVLICFEDNFPQQAREHATPSIDFLLNLTNDAWFGESAAQWQHAANAVFRAIENGLPLVRCTNNGLSVWIDPLGRLHSIRLVQGQDVYAPGFEIAALGLGNRQPTLYNRFGDVFGWTCAASMLLLAVRIRA